MSESIATLLARAASLQREGRRVIACLLVKARGSTPQQPGALMLVDDAANAFGTIGGGCVEAEVRRHALRLLEQNATELLTFKLDHDYGWDDGLICGGTIELAVGALPPPDDIDAIRRAMADREQTALSITIDYADGEQRFELDLPPRPRLYIAGAGHISQGLAPLARDLDFDVTVFDDRHDMLQSVSFAGVATVAGDIAENLRGAAFDESTYCAIITRGHRHDEQVLHAVIDRPAAYIGMIGSRRKIKLIFGDLRALGVDESHFDRVRAPIGLDIDAVTVPEIALSIAAELVQVRRSSHCAIVRGPLPAILEPITAA